MSTLRMERHAHLCVGGPLDGQSYEAEHSSFKVPVRTGIMVDPLEASFARVPRPVVVAEDVLYVECSIVGKDGSATFWAPAGTTPLEMLDRLAKGYRPGR